MGQRDESGQKTGKSNIGTGALSDLRSVLRSIASSQQPSRVDSRADAQARKPVAGVQKGAPGSDLKSALARAIAEIKVPQGGMGRGTRSQRETGTDSQRQAMSALGQPVSLKQVERMLRITGNDKPPIRL